MVHRSPMATVTTGGLTELFLPLMFVPAAKGLSLKQSTTSTGGAIAACGNALVDGQRFQERI
ncbi:MAG: hypothetical protein GDA56_09360 [Hormoscilla sp. GM7CHS1pb]|nr:hypothetical protein [Hormoscilla sp. GM7CHS1pb]